MHMTHLDENRQVLTLSGAKGDTRRYRSFHLLEQLQFIGAPCVTSHISNRKLLEELDRSAIVIFHRVSFDKYVERLFEMIRSRGILAIADVDDLIFDPSAFEWIDSPDFQDPFRAALYKEDMRRNRMVLERCNAAIVSTEFLGRQVRLLGLPVWTHRNAFSLEMLEISENVFLKRQINKEKIVIGYASGTPTHDRDFAIVKPALKYILHNYPQSELHIYGPVDAGRDWGVVENKIKIHKLVPWRELPKFLVQFNINIAPLVMDNSFGKSKSEIKYVEASLVRVPTIASSTEAYEFAIQSGVNGFLANNEQEWVEFLSQLVEQEETRQSMGLKAYEDVMNRYHPIRRAKELLDTLNQIHQQYKGVSFLPNTPERQAELCSLSNHVSRSGFYIDPIIEQKPTLFQRGLYSIRYRGILTLVIQCYIFIRRLLAPWFPFRKNR